MVRPKQKLWYVDTVEWKAKQMYAIISHKHWQSHHIFLVVAENPGMGDFWFCHCL